MAGATFQVILHNPLAEPFTLGVTGGAAVGAVIAITVPGLSIAWGPFSTAQLLALVGAAAVIATVYAMASRAEGMAMDTLLLAGVTISILCAGGVLLVRYIVSPHLLVAMDRWLMGGLDVVGYRELAALFPLLLPGIGLLGLQARALNHLSLGRELAKGHGVDVASVQKQAFVGCGIATAAVVSLAGPIGFVGLIVPHAVRRLSGYDHRIVLPGCFLLGGAALAFCDAVARTVLAPTEMPVGIVTALVGGPLFIRLLLKGRR
jgi:iron complex transport system permease protein